MYYFDSKIRKQKKLKTLIRNGIPPELRGQIWYISLFIIHYKYISLITLLLTRWNCSGAEMKKKNAKYSEQYNELLKRIDNNECNGVTVSDIDKDVNRTFSTKIVSLEYRRPSQVIFLILFLFIILIYLLEYLYSARHHSN